MLKESFVGYLEKGISENWALNALLEMYEHHKKAINQKLPGYMNVTSVELQNDEFIKTPKKSIKRYLYN